MTFLHMDKNPLILPFFRLSTSSQCLLAGQMLHSFNHHGPVLDSPWKILVFLTVGSPALGSAPQMCLPTAEERHPLPWPAGNALPNAVFVGYLCHLMVNFPTGTHRFSPACSKGTSTILWSSLSNRKTKVWNVFGFFYYAHLFIMLICFSETSFCKAQVC